MERNDLSTITTEAQNTRIALRNFIQQAEDMKRQADEMLRSAKAALEKLERLIPMN